MKTVDLPIGAHVAYDRWEQRDKHNFVEAYVIAHRPKGNRPSYWGSRTGNNDTIGIMYHDPWGTERQAIRFKYVNPSTIHHLWDDYTAIQSMKDDAKLKQAKIQAEKTADRTARFNALPTAVQALIPAYKHEALLTQDSVSMYVSVDLLEKLVEAAINATEAESH